MEIFGDNGLVAIWHTVLLQIAGLHMRRDDFQIAASGPSSAAAACKFPLSDGVALQCRSAAGRSPVTEMEQPCLRARIELSAQRIVVSPGEVHAARLSNDVTRAV